MGTAMIDADELAALRTMARRGLELSEMVADGRLVEKAPARPRTHSDRLTKQELDLIGRLIEARGGTVPHDRLIRHVATTGIHAETDAWNLNPATTVSWARRKLRGRFGQDCIGTVWHMRTNARGHVVRDVTRGIEGYRWTGPDLEGMALEAAAELGLIGSGEE